MNIQQTPLSTKNRIHPRFTTTNSRFTPIISTIPIMRTLLLLMPRKTIKVLTVLGIVRIPTIPVRRHTLVIRDRTRRVVQTMPVTVIPHIVPGLATRRETAQQEVVHPNQRAGVKAQTVLQVIRPTTTLHRHSKRTIREGNLQSVRGEIQYRG